MLNVSAMSQRNIQNISCSIADYIQERFMTIYQHFADTLDLASNSLISFRFSTLVMEKCVDLESDAVNCYVWLRKKLTLLKH